jgi:hypothetical protein
VDQANIAKQVMGAHDEIVTLTRTYLVVYP